MLSIEGRVVMISGANRGIGRAIAHCLHGKGYAVSLGARNAEAIDLEGEAVMRHHYDATDIASNEASNFP